MSQSDFVTRGQALVTAGQYQEAVKVCRLGLLGRPTTVEGRVVLGQALLALKRYDEVLAEMRVALELDHTSITAQVLKGEALLRKGDSHGALEVLQRVRAQAPTDPRIASLLDEAERAAGRPRISAVHPAVGYVNPQPAAPAYPTKAYVPHAAEDADEEDTNPAEEEDTGGSYTRPTSLSAPGAKKRSTVMPVAPMPSPGMLAVGDRSGTVEVDPEIDGVEMLDDDIGDVASPPVGGRRAKPAAGARGAVLPATRSPKPQAVKQQAAKKVSRKPPKEVSTVELDDDDVELDETSAPEPVRRIGRSEVRAAVNMPSGALDTAPPRVSPAANRPTAVAQPAVAPPPHLAQMIANQPHMMAVQPLDAYAARKPGGNPINAALPTAIAPLPAGFPMQSPQQVAALPVTPLPGPQNPFAATMMPAMPSPAAALPTMALGPNGQPLTPAQQQSAAAVDAMFSDGDWGSMPPQQPPSAPPGVDPMLAAMFEGAPAAAQDISQSGAKAMKTGVRRTRSKLQILLWVFLGALVIGGGVVVGFKIRAMRLEEQIEAARDEAVALAKLDTWKGWIGARDRLAGIAQASPTVDNLAALARTRALVAYEFGDGFGEAKAAVDALGEGGGLAGQLARAYIALAQGNAKAARAAADAASGIDAENAAVLYLVGQAQLHGGDIKAAIATLKKAVEKEPRPLYWLGLARAHGAATQWDEALSATEKALALSPEHPGALIERAMLSTLAGRVVTGTPLGVELRAQLDKIVAEGAKQFDKQERGVSPGQVAFADLALARVDAARGDLNAAQAHFRNALAINHDELRFAEEVVETLFATGTLKQAIAAAELALEKWPESRRVRTTLAEMLLASGKQLEARDAIAKIPETQLDPRALAVRARVHVANGDADSARKDYTKALERAPTLEAALVGLAWLDIAAGDYDAARKRIEPRYKDTSPPSIAAVWAAILRASGESDAREKAKTVLENAVKGAPSIDNARAWLELARLYRDIGGVDALRQARTAYENASRLPEAKLETALLLIEDRAPQDGRLTLESLLTEAGDKASAQLLLEVARARMLVGDHDGAFALFPRIEAAPGVVKWQLARERGRYFLRKADFPGAAQQLAKAIEDCGEDAETFLLAADAAADGKQTKLLARVKELAPKRLKGRPEATIVEGKIALNVEANYEAALKLHEAAVQAFEIDKATPRRVAQANFGRGVAAYYLKNDPAAKNDFELVIGKDPTIFAAYLYLGDMVREQNPNLALEYARKAVSFNPDLTDAWVMIGTLASRLRDRKLKEEAIRKVAAMQPNGEALRTLQSLP